MRATAFVVVLSMVLLSTAALAGDSAKLAERTHVSGLALANDPLSRGPKSDVPGLVNYQGTLTDDNGVALDTTVSMTFSIYTDSTGGTQVWTETQPAVEVSSGLFNVLLGRVNAISDTVFSDPERWLGVQVGVDPELTPRQRMAAVGYAFWAAEADTAEYARNALGGSDGDWTVSGSDMYSAVPGNVGIGITSPLRKLHVVGDDTLGSAMIVPDESVSGDDAELVLGEDNDATYHMKLKYDGGVNQLQIYGQASTTMYGPHIVVERNSGDVGIGTESPAVKLHVVGNTRITGDLNMSSGNVTVAGPEKIKQPTQTVTYRFSPGGWSVRTDVGDVFQEPVGFTTSLMLKGGGAGNQNVAVMPLCLPRTGTIKEMRVRCRMTGPSGTGTAFQVVLLHQAFGSSVGSPSGDPSFFVYYDGASTANLTLTETQDHAIQTDHTYLLFAQVYGTHVNYVEIGMVELDVETAEYGPSTRW